MLTEKPDSGGPKRDCKKTSLLLSRVDLVLRLEKKSRKTTKQSNLPSELFQINWRK